MHYLADFLLSLNIVDRDTIPRHHISYIPGQSPFSTWLVVITMTATYLAVVFGTREIMKDRAPLKLTSLFRTHNLLLSAGSLVLMVLIGEEVFSNWLKPDISTYGSLCSPEAYTDRLEFYLMINYYFKYYEFIDTVFLALKKKPLRDFAALLHVYHHAATVVLVFVQLNARATVFWIGTFLNLGVHVLMYYYYFATAGGAKLWWKKHLTTIQITQFLIILAAGVFASYQYIAFNWLPAGYLPNMGGCTGTPTAGIVGGGIVYSYLLLFRNFFHRTYLGKPQPERSRIDTAGNSACKSTGSHVKPAQAVNSTGSLLFRVETSAR